MEYESLIERNVNYMSYKLFGDKDITLKTITKMNLLFDGEDETKENIENTLLKMKRINVIESEFIKNELSLTYDRDGNIVYADDIENNEYKNEVCDESKGEPDTDFKPSNR